MVSLLGTPLSGSLDTVLAQVVMCLETVTQFGWLPDCKMLNNIIEIKSNLCNFQLYVITRS